VEARNGRAVRLTLPPGAVAVYARWPAPSKPRARLASVL